MPFMPSMDRNQMMICSLNSFVDSESIARVIDVFVESLDLKEMGFEKTEAAAEGRPPYRPQALLKLYLYGNRKQIRSSRKLSEACKINIEAKWLMEGLEPDFRTISEFRKNNIECMKGVFHEFNARLFEVLMKGFKSVDGSKFQAWNSKDRNFTANKLDDRITWLNQHAEEYLRLLEEADAAEDDLESQGQFTREELEKKLEEVKKRLERYEGYRSYMEENGLSQISLTDPEARLMKSRNGFMVAYNVQTAVDSETHMIEDFQVTNQPNDQGLLESTLEGIKAESPDEILEATADKGYIKEEDMVECLEKGIVPHVILPTGQDTYELEMEYEEVEIEEADRKGTGAEEIKKCLHAGEIPEAYEEVIEKIEVVEKKKLVYDEEPEEEEAKEETAEEEKAEGKKESERTEEGMKARASEGYFVRDPERNLVYCPCGEILRQKSIKKNGNIRYANKTACRRCPHRNRCYKGKNEWKEIDFPKDKLEKPCKTWKEGETEEKTGKETEKETEKETRKETEKETGKETRKETEKETKQAKKKKKGHYEKKKIVRIVFRPDRRKMFQRKCISEHPFGSIKRWMNAGYYLLRGMRKTAGETALICLGYNLERAKNLLGFEKLMEIVG